HPMERPAHERGVQRRCPPLAKKIGPIMQQKNFVVFLVLCIVILTGWTVLSNLIWPPPETKPDAKAGPVAPDVRRAVSLQGVAPGGLESGLTYALRLVGGVAAIEQDAGRLRPDPGRLRPDPWRYSLPQLAALVGSPTLGGTGALLHRMQLGPVLPTPPAAGGLAKNIALSGPDFFLQVTLTTRGAGVRRLILPQFQAATELGKPKFDNAGKPVPFELIGDDPIRPSFTLHHYRNPTGDPDDKDESQRAQPLTTLGDVVWEADPPVINKRGEREVRLWFDQIPGYAGIKTTKIYTLGPKDYHLGLQLEITDNRPRDPAGQVKPFRYQLTGAHGLPIEGAWYANVHLNPMIGLLDQRGNLWRDLDETQLRLAQRGGGERVPDLSGSSYIKYAGPANQYFTSLIVVSDKQAPPADGGVTPENVLAYARGTLESTEMRARVLAVDLKKNLLVVLTPESAKEVHFTLLERARENVQQREIKKDDDVLVNQYEVPGKERVATGVRPGRVPHKTMSDISVAVTSPLLKDLRAGKPVVHKFLLYNGPVKVSLLGQFRGDKAVDPDLVNRYWDTLHLRTLTDYRSPGPFGWFAQKIFWTDLIILFTRLMHWLLDVLHMIVPNYGLAIILLTIIVRALMFPISRRQSMLSIKMQELAPELRKVQEKYKNDPQQRTRATMELYRKHGVNPLGGCLTLLLQLPIFMGLYFALQESIHFRLASFLWIDNLAAPDMFLYWGESIPVISDPDSAQVGFLCFPTNPLYLGPFLNLLPIAAMVLMLVQQKMMTPPAADPQAAFQQKMMKFMMIVIGIFFYKLAAGLCLYFIVSSVWGLLERRLLPKRVAATPGGGPGGGGGGGGGRGSGPSGGRFKAKGAAKKGKEPEGAIQKVRNWWQDLLKQAKKK
ncbi:MAG: membrane protein insertase YidC, partial [Gemmataceae bacterium]|nr:membrane protein insertase YidC [Gemmataceae bacterium]